MKSANPSTRLLKQPICSIDEKEKKLFDCHYVYYEKAKVSFDDKEQVTYLTEKTDMAMDFTDACTIFIDDVEERNLM